MPEAKFLVGKNDRLFLDNDFNAVLKHHSGELNITPQKKKVWQNTLEVRKQLHEKHGSKACFLIPPDTPTIFPEDLPFKPVSKRPVHEVLSLCEEIIGKDYAIFPDKLLKKQKSGKVIFPKTDTHWSTYGAYLAYKEICKKLDLFCIAEEDLEFKSVERKGDLGSKCNPHLKSEFTSMILKKSHSKITFNNHTNVRGRMQIFQNTKRKLPVCLWFGTSYSYPLLRVAKESFRKLIFIHRSPYDQEIMDYVKPDIVINEIAERFLVNPPNESRATSHFEIFKTKLDKLTKAETSEIKKQISNYDSDDATIKYFVKRHLDMF